MAQLRQLVTKGVIKTRLRLNRCSLCNEYLRHASAEEINSASYALKEKST